MQFTSFLLALPLIGSVLAAPLVAEKKDTFAIEERGGGGGYGCTTCHNVDIIQILTEVEVKTKSCVPAQGTVLVYVDVKAKLNIIIEALTYCNSALVDAIIDVNVDINLCASLLVKIIINICAFIACIPKSICSLLEIKLLLKTCDTLLFNLLISIKLFIPTILSLCANLCVSLNVNISVYLASCGGLLNGLIKSILGLVGGIL